MLLLDQNIAGTYTKNYIMSLFWVVVDSYKLTMCNQEKNDLK